jgi:hypothetical protein
MLVRENAVIKEPNEKESQWRGNKESLQWRRQVGIL